MSNSTKREAVQIFSHDDVRCRCGQLVACWAEQGIEIKCKRCRRIVTIAFDAIQGRPPAILAT